MATNKAAEPQERSFSYNGIKLVDPDASMTPEAVRDFYAGTYPQLTNASIKGPTVNNNVAAFDFKPVVATKG
jgi:PRTRC genetic system protein C